MEEGLPFVKLVACDAKTFTELVHSRNSQEVFSHDAQQKEETIGGVGDDDIRKDGMGMCTAFTEKPEDDDLGPYRFTVYKIHYFPAIISMDMTVSLRTADRAGFQLWSERIHVRPEHDFC